jgi:hypothetical protein
MTDVQQERERCARLVEKLISRNQDSTLWGEKLKRLLNKIRNPKSTGRTGGLLTEQLELPFGD